MPATQPAIDISRKFVRLIEQRADGLVEFEFAIGEPALCAEMLLPVAAFEAFCERNAVVRLPPHGTAQDDNADDWGWTLRHATQQRFR